MYLGYNTNGLAHHELFDAVTLLAELGYCGVAVTIDHGVLAPRSENLREQIGRLRQVLGQLNMRSVIETGARFLLDPRKKHEPTLLSADPAGRNRRIDFYKHAVDCAAELGSDCISLWSGALDEPICHDEAIDRLAEGIDQVVSYAAGHKVTVGFEPEPGMLIDSMHGYEELLQRIDAPNLRLTLDIGHLHCQGEVPIADYIRRWGSRLVNVHIEDMRAGVHEHLLFGQGQIDFPPVIEALRQIDYHGGLYVELSRHGHMGPTAARTAMEFLGELRVES